MQIKFKNMIAVIFGIFIGFILNHLLTDQTSFPFQALFVSLGGVLIIAVIISVVFRKKRVE